MEELEIKNLEQFNILTDEDDIIISLMKLDREQPIYNVEIKDNKYYLDDVEIVFGVSKLVDGAVENPSNLEEILEQKLEAEAKAKLRAKRTPLLAAFDIYKSNVAYGVVDETEDEHILIKEWYNAILELNDVALDNVPECIGRYL